MSEWSHQPNTEQRTAGYFAGPAPAAQRTGPAHAPSVGGWQPGPAGPVGAPVAAGPQWQATPTGSSGPSAGKVLAIVGAVVVALAAVLALFAWQAFSSVVDQVPGGADTVFGELQPGQTYGDNPELDALWDACAAGEYGSCDELYFVSQIDSEYEAFGDSCGRRNVPAGLCTQIYAE